VGAGRIGSFFDNPKTKEILTHAHAYKIHPKIDLIGFFDTDRRSAIFSAKKWSCTAFRNLEEMFGNKGIDIVSVCTPDKDHFPTLMKLIQYKPRLVVCEKPLTDNLQKTKEILKLYGEEKIPLLVNYSRRFDKNVQSLKRDIQKSRYGKVLLAVGIYTKGILHNGSHLIDLVRYLFGEVRSFEALYSISDHKKGDVSVAGFLKFERCPQFYLTVGDERKYSIFELDILLEKRRLRFFDSGLFLSTQTMERDPLFKGFYSLGKPVIHKTSLTKALLALINNAINHLEYGEPLICDMEEAFKTEKICQSLLKNWRNQK